MLLIFSLRFGCLFPGQLDTVKYSPHLKLSFDKTVQNRTSSCDKFKCPVVMGWKIEFKASRAIKRMASAERKKGFQKIIIFEKSKNTQKSIFSVDSVNVI